MLMAASGLRRPLPRAQEGDEVAPRRCPGASYHFSYHLAECARQSQRESEQTAQGRTRGSRYFASWTSLQMTSFLSRWARRSTNRRTRDVVREPEGHTACARIGANVKSSSTTSASPASTASRTW
jgi:hypothetical protein